MTTPNSDKTPQPWLGAVQAAGFVAGGILGYALGKALGMDPMDPAGYTTSAMVGILLVGLCSGGGAQLARRWYLQRNTPPEK